MSHYVYLLLIIIVLSVSGKSSEDKMLYLIYLCASHYIVSTHHLTKQLFWFEWSEQSVFARKKNNRHLS